MSWLEPALRWLLGGVMVAAGIGHFIAPQFFLAIVPAYLPSPLMLVYISGVAEIAGGVGLQLSATRRAAGFGLIALFIAVFPANVNQAMNHILFDGREIPAALLWARLPLQAVLVAWAWWYTRPDVRGTTAGARRAPDPRRSRGSG